MRRGLNLLTVFVFVLIMALTIAIFTPKNIAYAQNEYVANNKQDLLDALARKADIIKVGNVDLEGFTITLNYSVSIVAKDSNNTIKNAYVKIDAPISSSDNISISFKNIEFDGCFDASTLDINAEKEFDVIFGSRDDNVCIEGTKGYYDLTISNCSIHNYASPMGPAILVENQYFDGNKNISIENSTFYSNYSQFDTVHLSNTKMNVNIKNCEFKNNYAYKGAGLSVANCNATLDGLNIHDNHFIPLDVSQTNMQNCGGGIYLGGVTGSIKNSIVSNNKTIFGGGIGVSPKTSGSGDIIFENITIKNNEAKYGGAICAHSISGQPIRFFGCNIFNNSAEYGSSLYSLTYAYFSNNKFNGGLVEFIFSTFAENTALDNDAFAFYRGTETKGTIGFVSLKGCLAIGNDLYGAKPEDYNYIATKAQAIQDGVVTEDMLSNCSEKGLKPIKGSVADFEIPASVYSKWADIFDNATTPATIGSMPSETPTTVKDKSWVIPLAVCVPVVIVLIVGIILIIEFVSKKKRAPKANDEAQSTSPDTEALKAKLATLNEREMTVTKMTINLKKRQEIADALNYSENTIKKDLSSIYQKLEVHTKSELISLYKDLI